MRGKDSFDGGNACGSVCGNNGKDASATAAIMPVQQRHWHGYNNGKRQRVRQQPAGTTKGQEDGQEEWGGGHDTFAAEHTVTKALFGNGLGRRQERGVNTQSAKRGTCSKDASNRGNATGNDKLARQKDKRAVQKG
jgi:hypothetical protein